MEMRVVVASLVRSDIHAPVQRWATMRDCRRANRVMSLSHSQVLRMHTSGGSLGAVECGCLQLVSSVHLRLGQTSPP